MTPPAYTLKFPARYQIEKLLGEGALGEVYLAYDQETKSKVVIKTLKHSIAFNAQNGATNIRRFYNEFNALKNCAHPNIVRVLDFSDYNQLLFFTMDYLEGVPLTSYIPAQQPESEEKPLAELKELEATEPSTQAYKPTIEQSIDFLFQIAKALNFVHERGLIHRDLKPANIFVTKNNQIKLLDFGLARPEQSSFTLTIANNALGTPYYMAPEASANNPLDHLADIYSFGIVAYELLAQELPYKDLSQQQLAYKHALAKVPIAKTINPEIPDWLNSLIYTCMQKDKKRRFQSMLEILTMFIKNAPFLIVEKELIEKVQNLKTNNHFANSKSPIRADQHESLKASVKRVLIVFSLVLLFLAAWASPLGTYSNVILLRTFFKIRGPITPPQDIVIVALDDLTYQRFGVNARKPFPRKYWAQALEKIHATHPKLVFIDAYIPTDDDEPEGNSAVEAAITKGPTVLLKWEEKNKAIPEAAQNETNQISFHSDARFSKVAMGEIAPFFLADNGVLSLISSSRDMNGDLNERMPLRKVMNMVGIENLSRPTENDLINFYGQPNLIKTYSMFDVIDNNYNFKDKIVFVGIKSLIRSYSTTPFDLFKTSGSFFGEYFGVEIHATIAGNLIDGSHVKRLPIIIEQAILAFVVGFIILYLVSKPPSLALIYLLLTSAIWFSYSIVIFFLYELIVPGSVLMLFCSPIVCAVIWCAYGNKKNLDLTRVEDAIGLKIS